MLKPFRTAAVLGAGVMGTQIAAHLANAGLTVYLLDLAAIGDDQNQIVESAFKKAQKQTPSPIFHRKDDPSGGVGEFRSAFRPSRRR